MPSLASFRDVDELDNRYIGKCVIYVEGEDDQKVWERIMGGECSDRLEFKVPYSGGAGSDSVLNRVDTERKNNSKIFGLVDGEVAARFGETRRLIACREVLFELDVNGCDGVLFLGSHELENVLVGESDLANFVKNNVSLSQLGSKKEAVIQSSIRREAIRFFVAALIKYAWVELHYRGLASSIGDLGHFRSDRRLAEEIKRARRRIEKEFTDKGKLLRQEVIRIGRQAKRERDRKKKDGGSATGELVRLADGKALLARLGKRWKFLPANHGLLVDRVCSTTFGTRFRKELLEATGA